MRTGGSHASHDGSVPVLRLPSSPSCQLTGRPRAVTIRRPGPGSWLYGDVFPSGAQPASTLSPPVTIDLEHSPSRLPRVGSHRSRHPWVSTGGNRPGEDAKVSARDRSSREGRGSTPVERPTGTRHHTTRTPDPDVGWSRPADVL